MELLKPSVEQRVEEIVTVNRASKVAREFKDTSPLTTSLGELNICHPFFYLITHIIISKQAGCN